jgi:hypothetical protein
MELIHTIESIRMLKKMGLMEDWRVETGPFSLTMAQSSPKKHSLSWSLCDFARGSKKP